MSVVGFKITILKGIRHATCYIIKNKNTKHIVNVMYLYSFSISSQIFI